MMQLADILAARRIVVKVGSSLLVRDGAPRNSWMQALARELAQLRAGGCEVIVVSSGAIALGAARLGLDAGGRATLTDAQAAASVGQIELARLWSEAIADAERDTTVAQILLTLGDLEDRARYLNAAATLRRLLALGAIPVVNENDSVATEEIRFGDNDRLAARVAQAAGADAVLLLSDVAGLYDRDPSRPRCKAGAAGGRHRRRDAGDGRGRLVVRHGQRRNGVQAGGGAHRGTGGDRTGHHRRARRRTDCRRAR